MINLSDGIFFALAILFVISGGFCGLIGNPLTGAIFGASGGAFLLASIITSER